jgi:hypothetical protein
MLLDILLESRRNPVQRRREVKRLDIVTDKCVNKVSSIKIFIEGDRQDAGKLGKHPTLPQAFGGQVQINSPRRALELEFLVVAG